MVRFPGNISPEREKICLEKMAGFLIDEIKKNDIKNESFFVYVEIGDSP